MQSCPLKRVTFLQVPSYISYCCRQMVLIGMVPLPTVGKWRFIGIHFSASWWSLSHGGGASPKVLIKTSLLDKKINWNLRSANFLKILQAATLPKTNIINPWKAVVGRWFVFLFWEGLCFCLFLGAIGYVSLMECNIHVLIKVLLLNGWHSGEPTDKDV